MPHGRSSSRKAVADFCEQRKISPDKLKKAASPTMCELDAPQLEADSSQLKMTTGPIARVLYIARAARPDVAYSVSRLARRATRWSDACERELVRLMGYLQSSVSAKLTAEISQTDWASLHVEVSTDADLAGDKYSARSTSGVFACLVGTKVGRLCFRNLPRSARVAEPHADVSSGQHRRSRTYGCARWCQAYRTI